MKFLVIFCVAAHLATAIIPPFTNILSGGGLGSLLGGGSDAETSVDESGSSGFGSSRGGIPGGQLLSTILGLKIGLLSALRNTVGGTQEESVDINNFEEDGSFTSTFNGQNSGGSNNVGVSSSGNQMFSSGSGFSQLGGSSESSGGSAYSSQGFNAGSQGFNAAGSQGYASGNQGSNQGYNYLPPVSTGGYAGQQTASNGGYVYDRPPQSFGGNSFSGHESSSGSASLSSNSGFASSGSQFHGAGGTSLGGNSGFESSSGSATQSGTAGFGSAAQLPIRILTAKRNGINSGFEAVIGGINTLQRVLGGGESNSIERRRY